jgi:hypothetical protein
MALEAKAASQFVGHPLKIGRFLQGDKEVLMLTRLCCRVTIVNARHGADIMVLVPKLTVFELI